MRLASLLAVSILLGACQSSPAPPMETPADSLAYRVTEGAGGLAAWEALPGIAFEWAVVRDSAELVRNLHLWDKHGDRARSEWRGGEDSVYVAVFAPSTFDPEAPAGRVALNGEDVLGAEAADPLREAHGRFTNDGYWLLAPLKVFDPGVRRAVDTDGGAARLAISFDAVGLTPGDRYVLSTDSVTGAMTGWSYVLEGGGEGAWDWLEPIRLETDAGPLTFSRMKVTSDGQTAILTEPRLLTEDDEPFEDLSPRLGAG